MSSTRGSAVVLAVLLVATGCGRSASREYTLRGQVLSVNADHTEATIKHDDIPGLMEAMTMSYRAGDPEQFEDLRPGDMIASTLIVLSNGAYLTNVRRVGAAPLTADETEAMSASGELEFLRPGQAVPTTAFVDQDGQARDFASFRGAPTIVTFIYTRCPMPTFCPLMDRNFAVVQSRIELDPGLKNLQLVSVSFDPLIDTPAVLKRHAEALGADEAHWTFLTGDPDAVDLFARRFGVTIVREADDPTVISHSLRTGIIDAEGKLVKVYTGNEWTPDQLIEDLKRLD